MDIDKINEILHKEIEYAKQCGMPQFTMGLLQAKKVLNDYNASHKCAACGGSGRYKDTICSSCNGTGHEL